MTYAYIAVAIRHTWEWLERLLAEYQVFCAVLAQQRNEA